MISALLKSLRRAPPAPPAAPEGRRIYAIGDIHGRADLLAGLHEMILADSRAAGPARCVAVYVGDYVDRGLHVREVIDRLLDSALPGFESVHLKGNHEDMMLGFLDDAAAGPLWLANGGDMTLASYGVAAKVHLEDLIAGDDVTCFGGGKDMGDGLDRHGCQLAVCHVWLRVNLNAQMVSDGWALAYRQYSEKYDYAERGAKADRLGMWAGRFTAPWEWRWRKREREL